MFWETCYTSPPRPYLAGLGRVGMSGPSPDVLGRILCGVVSVAERNGRSLEYDRIRKATLGLQTYGTPKTGGAKAEPVGRCIMRGR